jgi:hypothetical protein
MVEAMLLAQLHLVQVVGLLEMVAVQAETVVEEPLMGPAVVALADIMEEVVKLRVAVVLHQTQQLHCPNLVVMAVVAVVARVKLLGLGLVVA